MKRDGVLIKRIKYLKPSSTDKKYEDLILEKTQNFCRLVLQALPQIFNGQGLQVNLTKL